jgi:demethylmenaquinone methyltransferase/2-methoxy-6-polyprenyl-1,4-benzoquinol methylase
LQDHSPPPDGRFKPHAAREMASMFDDVSRRYDLLNAVMTLGQDSAWREAMWRRVPGDAGTVLDLCTGSGASLAGLRRVGRTVLGIDVSLGMLRVAADLQASGGWSPRLACADAFALPLRDASIDAITIAFGVRNLRPRRAALAELSRVLRPGGRLVVLEAAAPAPGPLAPLARAWIRHAIPLAGRLSGDPSAYRYLSESIFEFGAGPEFAGDLDAAGFRRLEERAFLLGATRLWVAETGSGVGQKATARPMGVQGARSASRVSTHRDATYDSQRSERGTWRLLQAITSTGLAAALAWALAVWVNVHDDLPLSPPQRLAGWVLILSGLAFFSVRGVVQWLRWSASRDADGGFG